MKNVFYLLFLVALLPNLNLFAQSNPTPFDLNIGNYSFNSWSDTSAAATYPQNMILHTLGVQVPAQTDTGFADWICSYNKITGPRFNGLDSLGIGIINTGNSQADSSCSDTTPIFVGEVVLGLNTINRSNIQVGWTGRMLSNLVYNPSGGTGNPVNRFYAITCQYRIGQVGPFQTFSPDSTFLSNLNDTTYQPQFYSEAKIPAALPASCENQSEVQLRWIYFQSNIGGGPRPQLGLDEISVTSDFTTQVKNSAFSSNGLVVSPNPSENGFFFLSSEAFFRVSDLQGRTVRPWSKSARIDLCDLDGGIYLLQTGSNQVTRLVKN